MFWTSDWYYLATGSTALVLLKILQDSRDESTPFVQRPIFGIQTCVVRILEKLDRTWRHGFVRITSALSTWKEVLTSIVYPVPINRNQSITGISTLYFSLMLITMPAGLVFDHFCFDHFDMLMAVAWWPKLTGDSDDQEFKLSDAHDGWILVCFFIVWYAINIIVNTDD